MTEALAEAKKDVVPSSYREKYKATGGTCGDFIATKLQSIAKEGVDGLTAIKAENGIEADRWSQFNPGMHRMNLANVLRGRFLNGETIKLLGREYNIRYLAEDFNFTLENTPASLKRAASVLELQDNERTIAALGKLFFPPEKKVGKSAEERAAEKAAKDAEKKKAKDLKTAQSARDKAKAALDKGIAAVEKADQAVESAKNAASKAADAVKSAEGDDAKKKAEAASKKANEAVGKAEDKAKAAREKNDSLKKTFDDAEAAVKALSE